MDYTVVRRKGQKNLRMHFNYKGNLIVSAPYYVSEHEIESFVSSNRDWIYKYMSNHVKHSFTTGDTLYLFGQKFNLVVNECSKNSVEIIENLMIVYSRKTESAYVEKIVDKYCSKKLLEFVLPRTKYWIEKLELSMPEVKICNAKTRWGSCVKSRNLIKISLMTSAINEKLIDMIVLHEVCHLVYMNHRKEFWNLMKKYMPDVEERKRTLLSINREGI